MKFFLSKQIKALDAFTIEHEPISSIDLMERAANALLQAILDKVGVNHHFCILAGPGNNGGDALALARLMCDSKLNVSVYLLSDRPLSDDCEMNRQRLLSSYPDMLFQWASWENQPTLHASSILIDGLFGSGLSRSLSGVYAEALAWINQCGKQVFSIDIPSGLYADMSTPSDSPVVCATHTFSFQFPKLSFFFAESEAYVGSWSVLPIGIHPQGIVDTESNFFYQERADVQSMRKIRSRFAHKGTCGHVLLIAGSKGMAGAAVLAAKAALRAGAGLVTVHGPSSNRTIVQSTIPEAIYHSDKNKKAISLVSAETANRIVAIGPGIACSAETASMMHDLIPRLTEPCVFDADALNILSQYPNLLSQVPAGSILTPHPGEFHRLAGVCSNSLQRYQRAMALACELNCIIILKGANTLIATPDGIQTFNSTGNPGMATPGSGDVLTGILAGLLAQGYLPVDAARLGVFVHGMAGDMALCSESPESLLASDLISHIGQAFKSLDF